MSLIVLICPSLLDNQYSWYRREDETSRAYAAFCVYRDMGASRTTRRVAREISRSLTQVAKYSKRYSWVQRCEEYDDWRSRQLEKAALEHDKQKYLQELEQYRQETLKLGRAITSNSAQLLKIVQQHLQDVDNLKPRDIANLSRTAAIAAQIGTNLCADALDVEGLQQKLKD